MNNPPHVDGRNLFMMGGENSRVYRYMVFTCSGWCCFRFGCQKKKTGVHAPSCRSDRASVGWIVAQRMDRPTPKGLMPDAP